MTIPRDPEEWATLATLICTARCGELAVEDVDIAADGTPLCSTCRAPCRVPTAPVTLEERLGPAWSTYIAVPPALQADRTLSLAQRAVVVALLDYLKLDEVRPSQARLAREAGLGVKACREALGELERRGLIARTQRQANGRGFRLPDRIDLAPLIEYLNGLAGAAPGRSNGAQRPVVQAGPETMPTGPAGTAHGPDDLEEVGPRRVDLERASPLRGDDLGLDGLSRVSPGPGQPSPYLRALYAKQAGHNGNGVLR